MREALLQCLKCGHRFVTKVFESGEAEQKNIPHYPVRCEKCGGEVRKVQR